MMFERFESGCRLVKVWSHASKGVAGEGGVNVRVDEKPDSRPSSIFIVPVPSPLALS